MGQASTSQHMTVDTQDDLNTPQAHSQKHTGREVQEVQLPPTDGQTDRYARGQTIFPRPGPKVTTAQHTGSCLALVRGLGVGYSPPDSNPPKSSAKPQVQGRQCRNAVHLFTPEILVNKSGAIQFDPIRTHPIGPGRARGRRSPKVGASHSVPGPLSSLPSSLPVILEVGENQRGQS